MPIDDITPVNFTQKYTTGRHRATDATPEIDKISSASPELESPTRLMKDGFGNDNKKHIIKQKQAITDKNEVKEIGRTGPKKEDPLEIQKKEIADKNDNEEENKE